MYNFNVYPSAKFISTSLSLLQHRPVYQRTTWWDKIYDPNSEFIAKWNNLFLVTCMVSLFLDPLYFYVPYFCGPACLASNLALSLIVTFLRTVNDCFYVAHILLKFRTAFVAPNSRVFGKGELVTDPKAIALRYLKGTFVIDVAAMLPLPQILIWFVVPALTRATTFHTTHTLTLVVLVQYVPRMLVMFPLNRKIVNSTGVVARTAWSGAAYNILLFILAAHVLGAVWYLWSIQRMHTCWMQECRRERNAAKSHCNSVYFDSQSLKVPGRQTWLNRTQVLANCDPRNEDLEFKFGLFSVAFTDDVPSAGFIEAYFYCLCWGLKNLSSYGQGMAASTYIGETLFSCSVCIMGLLLFSHLIGQIQTYLQSMMVRVEEWRIKRRDTEEWMQHRQLPEELRERIRRFVQYKWLATRGVVEEAILQSLPLDLRREIQKHLCLGLVRRVHFFAQMDDQLLDAICERLVSSLSTKGTYIIREGDPVTEMLFIIRGQLESSTTYGGRSGFYNSITLRLGDFCGEELVTWAMLPTSTLNLPSSTRTVKALTEVEAFALRADDLKYVATQFKRLRSKRLQHAFRFYSHQWRMWGACFIQVAWRRYKKRKMAEELGRQESYYYMQGVDENEPLLIDYEEEDEASSSAGNLQPLSATILASKFAANTRQKVKVKFVDHSSESLKMPKMFKPEDPDFSADM
ncbi:Cyclic nucleotide-gated ion channel 18 [Ancistrocladus abbreviatus]